jgi:dipeptidyl aminopeptidase/acylaminoacyl peptidase
MIAYHGNRQILLRHADTDANPVAVTKMDLTAYLQDWSRDGRYITYTQQIRKGGDDLMALPMSGDKAAGPPFLVFHTPERSLHTALSPDSQWLALSTNKGDTYEVFVTPFSDQTKAEGRGPRWQVSTHGGVDPKWSPQGNQIYFLSRDFKKLLAADFKPGNPPTTSGLATCLIGTSPGTSLSATATPWTRPPAASWSSTGSTRPTPPLPCSPTGRRC